MATKDCLIFSKKTLTSHIDQRNSKKDFLFLAFFKFEKKSLRKTEAKHCYAKTEDLNLAVVTTLWRNRGYLLLMKEGSLF